MNYVGRNTRTVAFAFYECHLRRRIKFFEKKHVEARLFIFLINFFPGPNIAMKGNVINEND